MSLGHVLLHLASQRALLSFGGFVKGVKGGYSTQVVLLDLGTPEILPGVIQPHLASLWVRVQGRVGLSLDSGELVVPGYLFGSAALQSPASRRHQPRQ